MVYSSKYELSVSRLVRDFSHKAYIALEQSSVLRFEKDGYVWLCRGRTNLKDHLTWIKYDLNNTWLGLL
jgi:hypothetical protein